MNFTSYRLQNKRAVFLIMLVFITSACVSATKIATYRPQRLPFSTRQVLQHLELQNNQINRVQAIGNFQVESWGESKSFKAIVVLERPASLRMEFLSFIGQPVQFLVCREGKFRFYSPGENKVMTGDATRFNLYRLLGVNLELEKILDILTAAPGLLKGSTFPSMRYLINENNYLLQTGDPKIGEEQMLWVNGENMRPRRYISQQQKQINLEIQWDDYQEINGLQFPNIVEIARPLEATKVKVKFSESSLNRKLEPDLFTLNIPPGTEDIALPGEK